MFKVSPKFTDSAFVVGLCLIAVGLPFSKFLVSLSQFVLLGAWVLSGNWTEKWNRIKANWLLWSIVSIYFLHAIGLLYTSDFAYALRDLRIKLPLLSLPVIVASMPLISKRVFHLVLALFCVSVFGGTLFGMSVAMGFWGQIEDTRQASMFISHIRFSLQVVIALFVLPYLLYMEKAKPIQLAFGIFVWLFLLAFLFVLKAFTGIVIFICCLPVVLFLLSKKLNNNKLKMIIQSAMVILPIASVIWFGSQVKSFYDFETVDWENLPTASADGEKYDHATHNLQVENGHYVWLFVAWEELETAWSQRSTIALKGQTQNHQPMFATVIRYMASKGLKKDKAGVSQLTDEDVAAIERGIANVRFLEGNTLRNKVYQLIWEIDNYARGWNPQSNSVGQRLEFWRAAVRIIQKNLWFGVGTGDVQLAFDTEYQLMKTEMDPKFWLHSHNQYLTITVALGLLGLLVFIWSLVAPFVLGNMSSNYLYIAYILVILLSMLNEDTLETQMGLSIYAFFNTIFVFNQSKDSNGN